MIQLVFDLPLIIAIIIDVLAVIVGASIFRWISKPYRILAVYLFLGAIISIIGYICATQSINNLFLFHFHTLMENILLSTILLFWIDNIKIKRIIIFTMISFSIFWFISKYTFEDISKFDNYTSSLNSSLLIIYSGYAISRQLLDRTKNLLQFPEFWVSTGILVYYSGCFILFALSNLVYFWTIHNYLLAISKIFFIAGFITEWKK